MKGNQSAGIVIDLKKVVSTYKEKRLNTVLEKQLTYLELGVSKLHYMGKKLIAEVPLQLQLYLVLTTDLTR